MHGTRREQGISARASASRQTAICCRVQATGRNAKEKTHLDQDAPQSFRGIAKRAFRGFNYFPTLLLTILDEQPARRPAPDNAGFFTPACKAGAMPNNKARRGTRLREG